MTERHEASLPPRSERGQSLTELAISFMIMMLLLAVAVDIGRVFFSFIAVREAAEEGAIYGSLIPEPSDPGDSDGDGSEHDSIVERVRGSSSDPVDLTNTGLVTVNVTNQGAACAGNTIRVSVTYNFSLSMPVIGTVLGTQQFPLTADAVSTVLRPPCP